MRFTTWTSAPWSNWVNHRGRAAAQPSICCQQQWKREEAGARDSFQLPKGKVVLGKAPDPHPQALQLRLHPGSLDDLHHLALLPLSDTTAPGSHYYLPPGHYLSPWVPLPGWLHLQPPCQTLLPNVLSPCSASSSQTIPFELSPQIPFHQPSDSPSAFPGSQLSSLSYLLVLFSLFPCS